MGRIGLISLSSAEETFSWGASLAAELPRDAVLALSGNLGAGKTTFVQGLAAGLGIKDPIQSPTFILLNLYDRLAHFDLYRLKKTKDFVDLGFQEYLETNLICAIEWPERIEELLPKRTIRVHFEYLGEERTAKIS